MRTWWIGVWLVLVSAAVAQAYEETLVENGATLSGRVVFAGERPAPAFQPVHKNQDVCGDRIPDESLVVSEEGGVANALVEVVGVSAGKPRGLAPASLDNEGCAFVPRVQALVTGQSMEIRNSDPILHDAHAWLGSRTIFNLGLPEWRRVSHEFEESGLHEINCNVLHTWMKAWVFVADHPYVVVTGRDGRFSFEDVPVGRYEVRVWHERLGEKLRPVELGEAEAEVDFAFP